MKYVLILILFIYTYVAHGQSHYAKYIVPDSLRKTHVIKHKDGGSDKINYLGVIEKLNGDTLYYVFTLFGTVQAAVVMHGHSNIIFLNKKRKEVKSYDIGMPDELPYKLVDNTLYFKYVDEKTNKKQIFKNKVGAKLP